MWARKPSSRFDCPANQNLDIKVKIHYIIRANTTPPTHTSTKDIEAVKNFLRPSQF
ncbi:predicted protein [Sclerotinia sclerotiorum 1980 UF-70]|uniref:Uncharacterized protein n=1 Tax=Sclerotinia sclerotiorum (strain ATCC 18683 / 1980 / Ss-1) TaxID=665079 RepID=A7F4J9_SCLS1|nr:predicted protein [Sclerotinia sclerotiorum 1980 UF-70]EDN97670.1 predicted protein [Sclerotinia sclerotiorum 1980 UF-70]